MTSDAALEDIDNVIRIHTDCISFLNEMDFDNENLVLEDKTTGLIHWKNCGNYHNLTTGYKSKIFKDIDEIDQYEIDDENN